MAGDPYAQYARKDPYADLVARPDTTAAAPPKPKTFLLPKATPEIGGLVGSLAGPPGAALGGMVGQAGLELQGQGGAPVAGVMDVPIMTPVGPLPAQITQPLARIGAQGIKQAALQKAGEKVFAGGAKLLGSTAMQAVLKRAGDAAPQVAQTAIREGITATRQGVTKLMGRLGESGALTRRILFDAGTKRGVTYGPADLLQGVGQHIGEAFPTQDAKILIDLSRKFAADNPGNISPLDAQKIGQELDVMAKPLHSLVAKKEGIPAATLLEAKWAKTVADNVRKLTREIPGVAESQARTSELIQLRQALVPGVKKSLPVGAQLLTRGGSAAAGATAGALLPGNRGQHALAGATIGATLGSPQLVSQLALLLHNPALLAALSQIPRGGAAVLE